MVDTLHKYFVLVMYFWFLQHIFIREFIIFLKPKELLYKQYLKPINRESIT